MRAGLAISPETPSSVITDSLGNAVDLLLVMTVRPGRGGQKFMPECLEKVTDLRKRFPGKNIQVDGGVGAGNACQCAQAGESA
jgi:ribulose-phosphate 3-epimerase